MNELPFPLEYVARDVDNQVRARDEDGGSAVLVVYHLLDAIELTVRFVLAVAAAEEDERAGEANVPIRLGEHPALGTWLHALDSISQRWKEEQGPRVVPKLGEAVASIERLARSKRWSLPESPWRELGGFRNWVAHGGVIPESAAAAVAERALPEFQMLMASLADVFADVRLVCVDDQGRGLEVLLESSGESVIDDAELHARGPGLYLGRATAWLQLWPIVRHAESGAGADLSASRLVTQVFVRLQRGLAQYATLDAETMVGIGHRAEADAYRSRFTDHHDFWSEMRSRAEQFVGRQDELDQVRSCVAQSRRDLESGAGGARWWLEGTVGKGKSALVTAVAVAEREHSTTPVLAHFFRSGDRRCSLAAFVELALAALPELDDEGPLDPTDTERAAMRLRARLAAQQPTVICDGLDELASSPSSEPDAVARLLALSTAGGIWVLAGRPVAEVVDQLDSVDAVFEGGLPEMSSGDMRALLLSQAPQEVRDAILLKDETGPDETVTNPYIDALVDRSGGLPLYLMLMLDWLSRRAGPADVKAEIAAALENPARLPDGLDRLYGELVDGWGLGALATKKTPILCLLAVAAEPLDVPALAELVHRGPARDSTEVERREVLCRDILAAFSPVLRQDHDADGHAGYRLDHDSFRAWLAHDERTAPVFDEERDEFAAWADRAGTVTDEQLARHLSRHGISYLVATKSQESAKSAAALLADFDYLHRRLAQLGFDGVPGLLADFGRVDPSVMSEPWLRFAQANGHLLRRRFQNWRPEQTLHQLGYDAPDPAVARAVREWSDTHGAPLLHRDPSDDTPFDPPADSTIFEGHAGTITGARLLSDGRILSWSDDWTLRIWDDRGEELHVLRGHTDWVFGAVELADGRILSWSRDATLRTWDPHSGQALDVGDGHGEGLFGAAELTDGHIVSWSADATLRIWDPTGSRCLHVLEGHEDWVVGAYELPDGGIVSWSTVGAPRLWDRGTGALRSILVGHRDDVREALVLTDGRVASWSDDSTLRIWNAETGQAEHVLEGHTESVIFGALQLSDGRLLSWSTDSTLRIWNLATGSADHILEGHTDAIFGALELADERILSWSTDWTLKTWDSRSGASIDTFEGHVSPIDRAVQLRDGRVVSCSPDDAMVRVWDSSSGQLLRSLRGHVGGVNGAIELPNRDVLTWSDDGFLRTWRIPVDADGDGPDISATKVNGAVGLAGRRMLTWSDDGLLRVWDDTGGVRYLSNEEQQYTLGAIVLSSGDILSWSTDGVLRTWRPHGGVVRQQLDLTMEGSVELPGDRLFSWFEEQIDPIVWNRETGTILHVLEGHRDSIGRAIALSNGRVLSWGCQHSKDTALRVWNPDTGEAELVLEGHAVWVNGARELSNGRILSWSADTTLRTWDRDTGELLQVFEGHDNIVKGAIERRNEIVSWTTHTMCGWDLQGELLGRFDSTVELLEFVPWGTAGLVVRLADGIAVFDGEHPGAYAAWFGPVSCHALVVDEDRIVVFDRLPRPLVLDASKLLQ